MSVLSINMAKQIQFVGKNFVRNFRPFDVCESKNVCLLSGGIDSSSVQNLELVPVQKFSSNLNSSSSRILNVLS